MYNILFICSGNTCRSCMAEAIAKKILREMDMQDKFDILSAGLYACPGEKASDQAVLAVKDLGIDLTSHCARQVNEDIIKNADVIFTMTAQHKKAIASMYPHSKNKVFTLKEYADGFEGDIQDPYGQSIEVYKKCANEIKSLVLKVLDKLIKQS